MINQLSLIAGAEIPFPELALSVHQPTIKQIATVGEEIFFSGCSTLLFEKEDLMSDQDRNNLQQYDNFEIIIAMLKDKSISMVKKRVSVVFVLTLLFPDTKISISNQSIILEKGQEKHQLTKVNYPKFREIVSEIFRLKNNKNGGDYKASGALSQRIVDKINKGRAKKNAQQNAGNDNTQQSVIGRYISILAVGERKDMNQLLNYTLYQLYDEFQRFQLKDSQDLYIKQKLAGAKDLETPDNWMKDLYQQDAKAKNADLQKFVTRRRR